MVEVFRGLWSRDYSGISRLIPAFRSGMISAKG